MMMRRACFSAMAGWLILSGLPLVGTRAAQLARMGEIEGITEYRLDNGLQVLLFPDASQARVTVNLTVLVGSRHEGYGETGMAHLLEHMTFRSGTPTFGNLLAALQSRGARRNGTTSYDRTNYFETLPASDDNLQFAVQLEAERLVKCLIKDEDWASEMAVVRNEFDEGENNPSAILYQRVYATAYEWHNYGKDTIGDRSDIERVPLDKLRAFYRKYYQPDNAVLVIAGRFDQQKALQYVSRYFGAIPRPRRILPPTYTVEPPQDGERTVVLRRVGETAQIIIAYHVPAGPHPDSAALRILSNILARRPTGRLDRALVETEKAAAVFASNPLLHDPGLMSLIALVPETARLEEVKNAMVRIAESVGREGVSLEEVERARRGILKERELALADTSRLAIQLSNWAAQGDWRLFFLDRDRVEKTTPDDVQRVARAYLRQSNRTVGLFIPAAKRDQTPIPAVGDLASSLGRYGDYQGRKEIAAGEAFDASPRSLQAHTLWESIGEGVKAAYLPKKSRGRMVRLRLTLRYGDLQNLHDSSQNAFSLLPPLMARGGAKHLSREAVKDELEKNQADLTGSGDWEDGPTAAFDVRCKRENLPAVLKILRQVLREPLLPKNEFEQLRGLRLAGLRRARSDPGFLAAVRHEQLMNPYPPDDVRREPSVAERLRQLETLSLDQLAALYKDYLGGQHGELVVVGDFDPDEVRPVLTKMLADWKNKMPQALILPSAFPGLRGVTEAIRTPDKANAAYEGGMLIALSTADADYPPLRMGAYIFGSGSSSRLFQRIRARDGLSYGVGGFISGRHNTARCEWRMSAIANPADMPQVARAMREELERLVRDGVTESELRQAVKAYLQSRRTAWSDDAALVSVLSDSLHSGRTMRWHEQFEKTIARTRVEEVNAALRKYIDPKRLIVVTGGDLPETPGRAAPGS